MVHVPPYFSKLEFPLPTNISTNIFPVVVTIGKKQQYFRASVFILSPVAWVKESPIILTKNLLHLMVSIEICVNLDIFKSIAIHI